MSPKSSAWVRLLVGVVASFVVLAPATNAYAEFTKDQLVQMSKMGIESSAIKGAIDGSEDFQVTEEELGELRLKGVSDEIIQYLKDNGYVVSEGESKPEKEEGDQKTAEKSDEETEPPSEEGEPAPADEPAESEQTDASEGAGPAPAPGEEEEEVELTEEEYKKKLEKAREEGKEKGVEELKEEEKRQKRLERAARRLPQAANALESGENMEAARIYLSYLTLEPPEGTDNWYEAKFGLGKALYDEGILSGAATPIRQVVMAGADRDHFQEAFRMLEGLTAKIGYQPPALEELTKLIIKDQPKSFRDEYNYYLGKFFYDYNRNELAIEYLDKVQRGADDYPESLYLKGVAQLAPSIDDKPAALKNFEAAIKAGERDEEANEEILQLGYLALARVFYEVGLYDVALFYYRKVPRDSARHAEALFEQAWAYFVKNDFKKALGKFHTLHSPYYRGWYFPDLYILEATVYLNLCRFDYSKQALAEFQKKYLDKRPRLQKFLDETKKPKAYWKKVTKAYSEGGVVDEGDLPSMFINAVLDDLAFYNMYQTVRNLRKEKEALKQNIDSLGDFGQEVLDRVDEQLATKIEEGGILVQQKLTELDQELQKWDTKATQISFDIDSEEKEQMQRRLQRKDVKERKEGGTTLLVVGEDWQPWPFEGEYWFDEVSDYRSQQTSRCIERER